MTFRSSIAPRTSVTGAASGASGSSSGASSTSNTRRPAATARWTMSLTRARSEEHTSELQSRQYLVCRLLLEKKHKQTPLPYAPPTVKRLYPYVDPTAGLTLITALHTSEDCVNLTLLAAVVVLHCNQMLLAIV